VTTLDRLLPDVGLDEPEILVHPARDLREDIRGALVAELVGPIDGVTGTLTIGAQRRRERVDVVPLLLAASPLLQGIGSHYFEDCNEAQAVSKQPADFSGGVARTPSIRRMPSGSGDPPLEHRHLVRGDRLGCVAVALSRHA